WLTRAACLGARIRLEHGQRRGLHDRADVGRQAQVAAGVPHAELALRTVPADERAGPFDDRAEAVAEAVDEREVDERPHDPAGEPAQVDPLEVHDRAEAADRGGASEVAVLEGLAR